MAEQPETEGTAPPEWLTADFLQEALLSEAEAEAGGEGGGGGGGGGGALRVTGFRAENAVGKGDNYASLMLRVSVDVLDTTPQGEQRRGERRLVVKGPPQSELSRAWVEKTQLFPKEQRMYRETLPRMQRALDRLPPTAHALARLAPRALSLSATGVLVLEDLREQGFQMAARQHGMDLAHCLLAMRALGLFHALSAALHQEEPACVLYEESFYTEATRADFELFIPRSFDNLAKRVETWQGFEHYAAKLRRFGSTIYDVMMKIFEETEDRFKVLNHADCWVNNMLFKYSENGEPIDIRLVDFQICRFASMALDLQYFLFSSPRPDIRTDKMDEMLSTYHTTYVQALQGLGCAQRAVAWEELRAELRRVAPFGVMAACNLLAIVLAAPSEAIDLEGVTEEEVKSGEVDVLAKALAGSNFTHALRRLLPYFDAQGAFA